MLPSEYKIMHDFETNYWWYVALHELIISKINKKSQKILDAGCGTGRLLELLSKHQSEGFDFSEEALEFCKSKGLNNVWLQDINTWQSEPKYDVIISADVICSTGIDDYKSILKNFYQALNLDGILILNLPAFEILRRNHDKAVFVGKRFRLNEIKNSLKDSGFTIKFATYRLFPLFFVILFEKFHQKIFRKTEVKSDLRSIPKFVNAFFLLTNRIENFIFRFVNNPFLGSSVFIVVEKI
ncbi:MAG: class I SAM-dependent methyltransferase [Bacteroidales bacterium]|nr:class I SAM-dependent methyltransferase [Bacteroidales bacterium]